MDGPLILNSIDSVEQGCYSWTQNQDYMFDDFLSLCLTITLSLISQHDDHATQLNTVLTRDFVFRHKRAETVLQTSSTRAAEVQSAPPVDFRINVLYFGGSDPLEKV